MYDSTIIVIFHTHTHAMHTPSTGNCTQSEMNQVKTNYYILQCMILLESMDLSAI